MENVRSHIETWARELSQTLEMMTGSGALVSAEPGARALPGLWWQSTIPADPEFSLFTGATSETWLAVGSAVLTAAGIDEVNRDEARSTWLEIVQGSAASFGRRLSSGTSRAGESVGGREVPEPPLSGEFFSISVQMNGQVFQLEAVLCPTAPRAATPNEPAKAAQTADVPGLPAATALPGTSRTMEALLDIHLPVSISFGQAKIPLREVLRLTAGSVVELNREPDDAVDVIVNDCVIARGEVVVVDGNYAVRIQSIAGRQQRLNLGSARAGKGSVTK